MRKIELNENQKTFIGIDVSKDNMEVFIDTSSKRTVCPNRARDLKRLAKELKKLSPELIVMEATGGYETQAAIAFTEASLPFAIVFPRRVRQLALGLGIIAKTDEIDARVIAYYGRVAGVEPKPLESNELRSLAALTARRSQLVDMRLMEENRLDTAHPSMRKAIKGHIAWLKRQTQKLDAEIDRCIEQSEAWSETRNLLTSVPASDPCSPRRSSPNCPNSAAFLTKRSPLWSASPLSLETPESSTENVSAKAAETPSAAYSTWRPSLPPDSIQLSKLSTNAYAKMENAKKSLS